MNLLEQLDFFLQEDELVDEALVLGGLRSWVEIAAGRHAHGRRESALRIQVLHLRHREGQLSLFHLKSVRPSNFSLLGGAAFRIRLLVRLFEVLWVGGRLEDAILSLGTVEELAWRVSAAIFYLESISLHAVLPGLRTAAREPTVLLRGPVDLLLDLGQLGDVLRLEVGIVRFAAEQYVVL